MIPFAVDIMRDRLTRYVYCRCLQLSEMRDNIFLIIIVIIICVTTSSASTVTDGIVCESRMCDSIALWWNLSCCIIIFTLRIMVTIGFWILSLTMGRFQGRSDSFLAEDGFFIILRRTWDRSCCIVSIIRRILKNRGLGIFACFECF